MKYLVYIIVAFLIIGCGDEEQASKTKSYLNTPVSGLVVIPDSGAPTKEVITSDGSFYLYDSSFDHSFYIGSQKVASIGGMHKRVDGVYTLTELFSNNYNYDRSKFENFLTLIYSLDDDQNFTNGIKIDENISTVNFNSTYDIASASSVTDIINEINQNLSTTYTVQPASDALKNYLLNVKSTTRSKNSSNLYILQYELNSFCKYTDVVDIVTNNYIECSDFGHPGRTYVSGDDYNGHIYVSDDGLCMMEDHSWSYLTNDNPVFCIESSLFTD